MAQRLPATAMLPKSMLPHDLGRTLDHARRVMGQQLPLGVEAELRAIHKNTARTLRRFGYAGRYGMNGRAAKLEYLLSISWGARVISVLHGYPKHRPPISWAKVKEFANGVCPRIPTKGPVLVEARPKSGGRGHRIISKGDVIRRANQALTTDLLSVRCGHSPFEFARRGRGRERLIEQLCNANRNGGVRAIGTLDVKDCFPSIKREAAYAVLPISKAITNNTIYISDQTPITMKTNLISEHAVRTGLPQGALSSVIVAGLIFQPCLDASEARFVASYVDDIIIGDDDELKVKALLDTLAGKLKTQHPSSPLFEKCRNSFNIGRPSDVLGYWPRPNPPELGGGIRFSPSNKAVRRFYVRLAQKLLLLPAEQWSDVLEGKAYAFAASFRNWGGATAGREILQTVFLLNIVPLLQQAHQILTSPALHGASMIKLKCWAAAWADKLIPAQVLATTEEFVGLKS